MPVVYMATNTVNGKRYIGATKHSLKRRKAGHLASYKRKMRNCSRFYAALRKYGPGAFEWVIVKSFETAEEAFSHERELISTLKPEYNILLGGEMPGYHPSPHSKAVICLEDGNIFPSITACAAFYKADMSTLASVCNGRSSDLVRDKHFQFFECYLSEQQRLERISDIEHRKIEFRKRGGKRYGDAVLKGRDRLGRSAAGPLKNARQVLCVTTGESHQSASAAAQFYNVQKSAIIELCLGKRNRKTVGGLIFKYAEAV